MIGGTRDWPATWQPASFNGLQFFVDTESLAKTGRDVALHTYVNSEEHSTEDMGRVPRELRCDAYLVGDDVDQQAQDFIELCSTAGAFTLVLPIFGPYQARCTNCHASSQDREKQGQVKLELEFIEAGTAGSSFPATPLGDRQAVSAMNDMPSAAASTIAGYDPDTDAASANAAAQQHFYEGM